MAEEAQQLTPRRLQRIPKRLPEVLTIRLDQLIGGGSQSGIANRKTIKKLTQIEERFFDLEQSLSEAIS